MHKSIYRNFYYIKETIAEFFQRNKKYLFFALLSVILGIALGIFIAISNCSSYTFINITDQSVVIFFQCKKFSNLFFGSFFRCLFLCVIILLINNFSFLTFANYILFGYLAFCLALDCVIFILLLGLKGILFVLLCLLPSKLILLFLFITIFLICKSSSDCCGSSFKISYYPFKDLLFVLLILLLICLVFSSICWVCSKIIVIIV